MGGKFWPDSRGRCDHNVFRLVYLHIALCLTQFSMHFYLGQGMYFNDTIKYLGYPTEDYIEKHTMQEELLANMHFPGFSPEAAQ